MRQPSAEPVPSGRLAGRTGFHADGRGRRIRSVAAADTGKRPDADRPRGVPEPRFRRNRAGCGPRKPAPLRPSFRPRRSAPSAAVRFGNADGAGTADRRVGQCLRLRSGRHGNHPGADRRIVCARRRRFRFGCRRHGRTSHAGQHRNPQQKPHGPHPPDKRHVRHRHHSHPRRTDLRRSDALVRRPRTARFADRRRVPERRGAGAADPLATRRYGFAQNGPARFRTAGLGRTRQHPQQFPENQKNRFQLPRHRRHELRLPARIAPDARGKTGLRQHRSRHPDGVRGAEREPAGICPPRGERPRKSGQHSPRGSVRPRRTEHGSGEFLPKEPRRPGRIPLRGGRSVERQPDPCVRNAPRPGIRLRAVDSESRQLPRLPVRRKPERRPRHDSRRPAVCDPYRSGNRLAPRHPARHRRAEHRRSAGDAPLRPARRRRAGRRRDPEHGRRLAGCPGRRFSRRTLVRQAALR